MGDGNDIDSKEGWRARSFARALKALRDASAPADRLALLRELTRLSDDILKLAEHDIVLTDEEAALAPRFSILLASGSARLDGRITGLPDDFVSAMRLDSALRRPYLAAPPDATLLRWSQHKSYRCETQKAALRAVATMPPGATLMVSMPTGTGKSLLFQAAPHLWPSAGRSCIALITPTVALALDHERTLRSIKGLEGSRALTGKLSGEQRQDLLDAFRRGEVPILILSPEMAFGAARAALVDAATSPAEKASGVNAHLSGLVVDEAHIVESWGRSFRPDFQRLPALADHLRTLNPDLRTMLLSATLGPAPRAVLRQAYKSDNWLEIHAGVPRFEFDIAASRFGSLEERDTVLLELIDHAPRPAILYTNQVEHAEKLGKTLRERGYGRLAVFTGALSDVALRQSVIDDWAEDRLDLIVATSAFGMGIDKADVRTIIHAGIPEGPARYYQEIGRAGRDGHQGIAIGLWAQFPPNRRDDRGRVIRDDETQASGMATGSWLSMEKAHLRWNKMRALAERQKLVRWEGGRRLVRFDIDAMHEMLDGESSDYNRRWNMSLLNLLQRAEALRITEVAENRDGSLSWEAEILLDPLFEEGPSSEELWAKIEVLRDAEQDEARTEFQAFLHVMREANNADECALAGIYRLIDPLALTPDCGRCPACRRAERRAPAKLHSGGTDASWPLSAPRPYFLSQGSTLIECDDVLSEFNAIVAALDQLGISQFVVPDGQGRRGADLLFDSKGLGFVTEHHECFGYAGFALLNVPTALFLVSDDARGQQLWQLAREFSKRDAAQSLVIVGARGLHFESRPLAQIASGAAPYDTTTLAALAASATFEERKS